MKLKDFTSTRAVVYTALIAAVYFVINAAIAPLVYGPLQMRMSNLLYPLVLFNPLYSLGFGLGAFLTNLGSPFGLLDIGVMPFVTIGAGLLAWTLRKYPIVAVTVQALVISLGVSIFPLGIGGQIPFMLTFPGVLFSNALIVLLGWLILWRPFKDKGIFEGRS